MALCSALATACGVERDPAPGAPQACTRIGCRSAVTVRLNDVPATARRVRVCAADVCRTVPRGTDRPVVLASRRFDSVRPVLVRVEMLGDGGRIVNEWRTHASLIANRPNGRLCPPTCFAASLRFDGSRGVFDRV